MNGHQNNQIIAIDEHRTQGGMQRYEPNLVDANRGFEPTGYDDEIDIKSIIHMLLRHKLLIIACLAISALYAYVKTSSITPTYRATTSVKIDQEGDKLANFSHAFREKRLNYWTFQQTQIDLLKSQALARRVIDKLELEQPVSKPDEPVASEKPQEVSKIRSAIAEAKGHVKSLATMVGLRTEHKQVELGKVPIEMSFMGSLQVEPMKESNVVKLHYISTDPQLAATTVNTIADEYIKMNLEGMSKSNAYAKTYLTEQIALAKQRLEESESRLVQYAKEKKIINTDGNKSLVSNSLEVLNSAYAEAQKELIEAESEYRQRGKISGDIRMLDNAAIQGLKARKNNLETRYKRDLQTYKPAFPAMIELKKQINDIQRQINIEVHNIKKNSQNDLQTKYLAAREKEQMLQKKLELKKAELLTQRDKSIGYTTLEREVDTNRQLYDNLLQRMKEVGIADGVVSNNISIVDKAFVPFSKFSPNVRHSVMMGALYGLLIGVGLAFLREKLDDRIKNTSELEALGSYPVLGVFPFIKKKKKDSAVLLEDQYEVEAEAFRSLVNNLRYIDSHGIPGILHITSASPSEGKSNTAINMGVIIAESNKRVLLVDADLRKPRIGKYLEVESPVGLSDFLVNEAGFDEIVTETNYEGLSLITAGSPMPNPAKLLADERLMELLEYAIAEFDHVVIDSPPVLGLADALILSNRSNATIFAVASNQTRKTHLVDALKRLKLGYGNVVGFVMTKSRSSKNDYYSYDNYYGYRDREDVSRLGYEQ